MPYDGLSLTTSLLPEARDYRNQSRWKIDGPSQPKKEADQAARTATQAMGGCSFGRKLLGTSTSVRGLDSCDPKETVMGAVPSNEM